MLPSSSPLQCTSPSDVSILLKFSSFVSHNLSIDTVFGGRQCGPSNPPSYQLRLVLREWYPVDRSCEFICYTESRCLFREHISDNIITWSACHDHFDCMNLSVFPLVEVQASSRATRSPPVKSPIASQSRNQSNASDAKMGKLSDLFRSQDQDGICYATTSSALAH